MRENLVEMDGNSVKCMETWCDAPTAPVDLREAIREAKEKSDKLAQAGYERIAELNIERRTPIKRLLRICWRQSRPTWRITI